MKNYKVAHLNISRQTSDSDIDKRLADAINEYAQKDWQLHTIIPVQTIESEPFRFRFILEQIPKPFIG